MILIEVQNGVVQCVRSDRASEDVLIIGADQSQPRENSKFHMIGTSHILTPAVMDKAIDWRDVSRNAGNLK